jgi:nucleoside-diphosphate-sugar epimerase
VCTNAPVDRGGTQFLGRAIAAHAYAIGYDVTCAARGVAGTVPYRARFIRVDRDEPDGLAPLAGMNRPGIPGDSII